MEEDMIYHMVVSHNGMIQWYCQVIATGPDQWAQPNWHYKV